MNKRYRLSKAHNLIPAGMLSIFVFAILLPNTACNGNVESQEPENAEQGRSEIASVTRESVPEEFNGFKGWYKANPEPIKMPPEVSARCLGPSQAEIASLSFEQHGNKYFTVFVNEKGRDRFQNFKDEPFPVGSIIVKQKHDGPNPESSELYTAMIKREPGYAPDTGDWEYFVLDGMAEKVTLRGQPEDCLSCHNERESNDFVFAFYR